MVDVAKFDTDPKTGYNVSDSRGEYWFEQLANGWSISETDAQQHAEPDAQTAALRFAICAPVSVKR